MNVRDLVLAAVMASGLCQAATLYVTPTGTDPAGGSWASPTSLTNALMIGKSNDAIWLAQGAYSNAATFTVASNGISLYGGFTNGMATLAERDWNAYPTILNGQGANRRVVTVSGAAVTLDGLVITNSSGGAAGGITKATAGLLTLANCRIVSHNNISDNTPGGHGPGGSFTGGSIVMTNCVVANNTKTGYSSYGFGIYASGANLDVLDCVFSNQYGDATASRSGYGGALAFNNGALRVVRSDFVANRTTANGGGGGAVYLGNSAALSAVFTNCLFRINQVQDHAVAGFGGAVWADLNAARTAAFVNCTFYGNTNSSGNGGAIYVSQGTVALKNSILWGNVTAKTGYLGREIYVAGGTLRASYGCLSGAVAPWLFVGGRKRRVIQHHDQRSAVREFHRPAPQEPVGALGGRIVRDHGHSLQSLPGRRRSG